VTNLPEKYVKDSIKKIDSGHIDDVVKTDLILNDAMHDLLMKLLMLLKHKGIITKEEIDGIASEVLDSKIRDQEELEARLMELKGD
jgi:hypothetical protein